jgi:hypothetical protein
MKSFKQFFTESDGESFNHLMDSNPNPHLGKTVDDVHDSLSKSTHISDEEHPHVERYIKASGTLNRALYRAHGSGQSAPTQVPSSEGYDHHEPAKLDQALNKPLTHHLNVMSGVRFNPGEASSQHPDGHLHLPAYTSTSIHPKVAHDFSEYRAEGMHHLNIHLKPGDKGAYVAHHADTSPEEREFILPRKTTLKVDPTPDIHVDQDGIKQHVWHATVHHQPKIES